MPSKVTAMASRAGATGLPVSRDTVPRAGQRVKLAALADVRPPARRGFRNLFDALICPAARARAGSPPKLGPQLKMPSPSPPAP